VTNRSREPKQLEFPFEDVPGATGTEPRVEAPGRVAVKPPKSAPPAEARGPLGAAGEAPPARPGLRVLQGGGQRVQEPLASRDAVVRVLLEAGADLLLRRISPERADFIETKVDKVLDLFDRVDANPLLMPVLRRELDDLEALMTETRAQRGRRQG